MGIRTRCKICGKTYDYLGSHLREHKILAKEYKERFGLPHNTKLISDKIQKKKRDVFNNDREKYLKNILNNKQYQFEKGYGGRSGTYHSKLELQEKINNLLKKGLGGKCNICKKTFKHLGSHLYNKHGIIS